MVPLERCFLINLPNLLCFSRAQGVYLGCLRFECWFEFDYMIPEAMFKELLQLSFTKNVEIGVMHLRNTIF